MARIHIPMNASSWFLTTVLFAAGNAGTLLGKPSNGKVLPLKAAIGTVEVKSCAA
jgi:hypothetical protein